MTITESPRNAWRQDTPGRRGLDAARPGRTTRTSTTWRRRTATPRSRRRTWPSTSTPSSATASPTSSGATTARSTSSPRATGPSSSSGARRRPTVQERQSFERAEDNRHSPARMEPEDVLRNTSGLTIEQRLADQAADGIDVELIFPNKGLLCWATPDPVFADAMCRAWNRWAARLVRRRRRVARRAHPAAGVDRHRRRRAGDGRGHVGGRARLRRPVPRQQPGLRRQGVGPAGVQRPALRAVLVADRGARPAAHVPRLDRPGSARRRRQRRGDHQLRLPQHGDDDRAARAAHHVGRVRAPPRAAGRPRRVGHRLRAVAAGDDGLRLPGPPHVGAAGDPRAAVDVLPRALLRHVPGGPRRPRRPPSATTSSTT